MSSATVQTSQPNAFDATARRAERKPQGQPSALEAGRGVVAPPSTYLNREMQQQMPTTRYPSLRKSFLLSPEERSCIRHQRQAQRMSTSDMAYICGVTHTSICHVENGSRNPSEELLTRICTVLNIPVASLLCELQTVPEDGGSYVI